MTNRWRRWNDALFLGVVMLVAGIALAAVGFTKAATRTDPWPIPYRHEASFAYTAAAPEGLVYDGSSPRPGEPVFRSLSDTVGVQATYAFDTDAAAQVEGTATLLAVLSNESGWRRELTLVGPQPLTGARADLRASLALAQVQRLIDALEEHTGVRSRTYTLAFELRVLVSGTIARQPFEDRYSPAMTFTFDPLQLVLQRPQGDADPFRPSVQRMFEGTRSVPNTFPFLAWQLPVPIARAVGGSLAGAGLVVVGAVVVASSRANRRLESVVPIAPRHRPRLVAVRELPIGPATQVVDLFSFDDLARVAEQLDTVILCASGGRTAWYAVSDGVQLYRFEVSSAKLERMSRRERAA